MFLQKKFGCGVVAACVAVAVVSACEKPAPPPVEKPLALATAARINGEAIYVSDVELEAVAQGLVRPGAAFGPGDEAYAKVLDQLIDQKLMAQEARARKLEDSPAAARRLEIARERILANLLVEDIVAREVTGDAVDKMYREQVALLQSNDEVRLAHILTATEADAKEVVKRLKRGDKFANVAAALSKETATRMEGGDLGWVAPNDEPKPFPEVIANTATGAFSAPFQSEAGWHVLMVKDRRDAAPKTREELEPEIISFLTLNEVNDLLRKLRTSAVVQDGGALPPTSETRGETGAEETAPATDLPPAADPGDEL